MFGNEASSRATGKRLALQFERPAAGWTVVAALCLGACGGGSGSATVSGLAFSARSAVFSNFAFDDGGRDQVTLLITSTANECSEVTEGPALQNEQRLDFVLNAPMPLAAGTFSVPNPEVRYAVTAPDCSAQPADVAASGSLTITAVSSSSVSGSFDLFLVPAADFGSNGSPTSDAGAEVTGSFDAAICPAVGDPTGLGTCQ